MSGKRNYLFVLCLLLAPALVSEVAAEKQQTFIDETDAETNFVGREAWKELSVEIPPTPRDQDLIRVSASASRPDRNPTAVASRASFGFATVCARVAPKSPWVRMSI